VHPSIDHGRQADDALAVVAVVANKKLGNPKGVKYSISVSPTKKMQITQSIQEKFTAHILTQVRTWVVYLSRD
jgi:hypothetical protein